MSVTYADPVENFPAIGTVENPSTFYDGRDLVLSYEIAPVAGGGIAVLKFHQIFDFRISPMNVEGLANAKHPTRAWAFTEVFGSDKTEYWNVKALNIRFWTISFNDVTVEIVFLGSPELLFTTHSAFSPQAALRTVLSDLSANDTAST